MTAHKTKLGDYHLTNSYLILSLTMNTQQIGIRQGDVCLLSVKSLPKGLKASKETVLLANGSGGHSHTFTNGTFYPKVEGDFVIGYLKAKGTKINHVEHSPKGDKIKDGIWEVRRQVETTHEGLRPIID